MNSEQMRELADELDKYVGSPTRASYYPSPVLRAADFIRQCAEQEPVAWVWERRYSNGGYSRELVVSEFAARELAKDDGNLPQPDLVYPLYAAPVPPQREPAHDIPLFDFDAEAWKQVLAAARDSKWMPAEYAMNDWLADICQWLRDGPPAGEQREPLSDAQLASVCLSYRHDFGLLDKDEQARLMLEARDWERAFRKEWQR